MLNPTTAPYSDTNGIFGDGGVSVFGDGVQPYQISVRRVAPVGDTTPTVLADHSNVRGDFPPAPTADAFTCTFALPVVNADPATYRVRPNGSATGANQYTPQGVPANGMIILGPPMGDHALDTHFNPSRTNAPWNSMVESNDSGAPSNKMLYTIPGTTTEANLGNSTYKRHVVQLRRLANPYLVGPSDTNPYITVDCVDHVPANDGVARLSGAATRTAKPGSPTGYDARNARFAVGKIQPYASFADVVAGAGTTPAAVPTITQYNAPTSRFSAVLQQSPGAPTTEQVKHTFGQHNGQTTTAPANTFATPPTLTDTIMVPYDWYVHFDRPLVNQLELLHLQGVKPHLVTQLTMQAPLAAIDAPRKGLGLAPFLTGTNGLFRSLDLLRVQDRTYGTPHGGKLHGKVNINTIMHKDVFRAVFDAQPQVNGLFTDDAVYNSAIAFAAENTRDDIWSRMIVSLTPSQTRRTATLSARKLADGTQAYVPIPGPTFHDIDPTNPPPSVTTLNLDRPYLPFGVGRFDAPAAGNPVFAFPVGSGLQDTLLRNNEVTNQPAIAVPGATHDYFRMEAARKVLNNFTTTSETFAVSFTITFHEVRMAGSTQLRDAFDRNLLGKEIYKDIPGDLRQQYFCVIDRANVATDLSGGGGVVQQPFFTTMEAPPATATVGGSSVSVISIAGVDLSGSGAGPFVVYADGRPVQLVTNTQSPPTGGALYTQSLAVGVGANAEGPFTFSQVVTTATPGVLQVTLASALTKPHAVGTSVSNAVVGTGTITTGGLPGTSPFPTGQSTTVPAAFGPPTAASSAQFSGMIPYFTRVR